MFTKEQASYLRQQFWTRFGKYMAPVPSASGEKVNWINYKTGVKQITFKMDAAKDSTSIGIYIDDKDQEKGDAFYTVFVQLMPELQQLLPENWAAEKSVVNEHGQVFSRIGTMLAGVSVFRESDWPVMISFLKPRIVALDTFWAEQKDIFEMIS